MPKIEDCLKPTQSSKLRSLGTKRKIHCQYCKLAIMVSGNSRLGYSYRCKIKEYTFKSYWFDTQAPICKDYSEEI